MEESHLKVEGLEPFGKAQIDKFRAHVEELKRQKQEEWIEKFVKMIQGYVLWDAASGEDINFTNITSVVSKHCLKQGPLAVPVPGLHETCTIRSAPLDLDFIKSGVVMMLQETFRMPVIVFNTETLRERLMECYDVGHFVDVCGNEYMFVKTGPHSFSLESCSGDRSKFVHFGHCQQKRSVISKSNLFIETGGMMHCKNCYLYKILSNEGIDGTKVPDSFFKDPIEHLRVIIKIPK